MPYEMPIIELKIREMGNLVAAAIVERREEVSGYIQKGIDQALTGIEETLVNMACQEARKQIEKMIENYFSYGEGRRMVEMIANEVCKPIAEGLKERTRKEVK